MAVAATVCLVGLTAACGGDDGRRRAVDEPGSEGPVVEEKDTTPPAVKKSPCTAEVSATGTSGGTGWGGRGRARTGATPPGDTGPEAVYTLGNGKNRVELYSPGREFKGSVKLVLGRTTYASDPADARSLDIDPSGRSASVDVTLVSVQGEAIDLVAHFSCGPGKGAQGRNGNHEQ